MLAAVREVGAREVPERVRRLRLEAARRRRKMRAAVQIFRGSQTTAD